MRITPVIILIVIAALAFALFGILQQREGDYNKVAANSELTKPAARSDAESILDLQDSALAVEPVVSIAQPLSSSDWHKEAFDILHSILQLGGNMTQAPAQLLQPAGETAVDAALEVLKQEMNSGETRACLDALQLLETMGPKAAGTERQILEWAKGGDIDWLRRNAGRVFVSQASPAGRVALIELARAQLMDCDGAYPPNGEEYEILRDLLILIGTYRIVEGVPLLIDIVERAAEIEEPADAETLQKTNPTLYSLISKQKWSNSLADTALKMALDCGSQKAVEFVYKHTLDPSDRAVTEIALRHLPTALEVDSRDNRISNELREWILARADPRSAAPPDEVRAAIEASGFLGYNVANRLALSNRALLSSAGLTESDRLRITARALQTSSLGEIMECIPDRTALHELGAHGSNTESLIGALLGSPNAETSIYIASLLDPEIRGDALLLLKYGTKQLWNEKLSLLRNILDDRSGDAGESFGLALRHLAALGALTCLDCDHVAAAQDPRQVRALVDAMQSQDVQCSDHSIRLLLDTMLHEPSTQRVAIDSPDEEASGSRANRARKDNQARKALATQERAARPKTRGHYIEELAARGENDGLALVDLLADSTLDVRLRISILSGLCRRSQFRVATSASSGVGQLSRDCLDRVSLLSLWSLISSELCRGPDRWWLAESAFCDEIAVGASSVDPNIAKQLVRVDEFLHKYDKNPSSHNPR